MKCDAKKAIAYLRTSTDEQRHGSAAQAAAIRGWATRAGVEVVATFEGAGISGGAKLDRRAALLGAVEALGVHGAGVLVVAKRDRLARDTLTAATVDRMVTRKGAAIVSADGIGNGATPEAVLARRMADAFAEYERALIGARTKAALAVKKARGQRVGTVPYGWSVDGDGVHLVENVDEQRTIKAVKALRGEGLSHRKIAARLNDMGIRTRRGGLIVQTSVRRILKAAEEARS